MIGVELMIPGIVIGVIVLVIVIWLISSYNGFVTLRNKTEEAFSAIDVSLKKRYDLIPNYVETVKGYAKHESETLEKVVAARNQAMTATNIDDKIIQEKVQSGALKSLFAVSESYPELKANENFNKLQDQLQRLEEEIANVNRTSVFFIKARRLSLRDAKYRNFFVKLKSKHHRIFIKNMRRNYYSQHPAKPIAPGPL